MSPGLDAKRGDQGDSQWIFSEDALNYTPSILVGLAPSQERQNRAKGVNFILQTGIMLKLPQITLSTAAVYLHRFFTRQPMVKDNANPNRPYHHYYSVAAACLFLATKVEENCRKMKELVVACVRVAQKDPNKEVDENDKEFWRWRDTILHLEDILLETLCFDLSLEQPYKILFEFLKYFGEQNNKPLRNAAWSYLNDSFITPSCLIWPSRVIAASALYAAARHTMVSFPDDDEGRPWWDVVGVSLKSIRRATNFIAAVYENAPLRSSTEETMFERTPEDGDELNAKTRRRRLSIEEALARRRREASGENGADVPAKQEAPEENGAEPPAKAPKLDDSMNGDADTPANGADKADVKMEEEEEGSEEGEVEE